MTKKHWFIGGGVLLLGIVAYFIYSMMNPSDLSRHIPKDALVAIRIDMASMGKKMPMEKMKDLGFMQFFKRDMAPKAKERFEKIINDPRVSGINFLQAPYLFVLPNTGGSVDDMTVGMVFGISGKADFLETMKVMTRGEIGAKEESGFTVLSESNDPLGKLFVHDEVAFFLYKNPQSTVKLTDLANNMLGLSNSNALTGDDAFSAFRKDAGDIGLYMNKTAYGKMMNESPFNLLLSGDLVKDMLDAYPVGYGIRFEDDRIVGKTISDPKAKSLTGRYLKDNGLSETDLTYLDPDGNPLMYLTANVNVKNIMETFTQNSLIKAGIEEVLAPLGLKQQDLESFLAGNMSIALNEIQHTPVYSDYDGTELYSREKPVFTAHATLGSTTLYDRLIALPEANFSNDGGILGFEMNAYRQDSFYVYVKNKELFVSNNFSYLADIRSGVSWKKLQAGCLADQAKNNPMAAFVNLDLSAFDRYMNNAGSSTEKTLLRAAASNLKHISAFASESDGEFAIQMSDKKQNSLWRMMLIADDLFKAAQLSAF